MNKKIALASTGYASMLQRITSQANPHVKALKSLHQKKARAETGLFLAEGARLALEAAELGVWPEILAVSPEGLAREKVARYVAAAERNGARVIETSPAILESITKRDNAQALVCAYRQRFSPLERIDARSAGLWLALEGVKDPGNLGTILRTADAVGLKAVILIGQTCDPFSVEAVRATMGSIFGVSLVRAEFSAFNAWRQAGGLSLIGAVLDGSVGPEAAGLENRCVLLMGNEQSGLPAEMAGACDARLRLPMHQATHADSLNLAIATGVALYEGWRRQGYPGAPP